VPWRGQSTRPRLRASLLPALLQIVSSRFMN